MALLKLRGLKKAFDDLTVINGLDLSVEPGEVVALFGKSGAGKTTTFDIIRGILPADGGEVTIDGLPPKGVPRRSIVAVSDKTWIDRDTDVRHLAFPWFRRQSEESSGAHTIPRARAFAPEKSTTFFRLCDVERLQGRRTATLKASELRRVELSLALTPETRLLLLDEPFSRLDPDGVLELGQVIRGLASEGLGVLITDHRFRDVLKIADRACVMAGGRVVAAGAPETVIHDPIATQEYFGTGERQADPSPPPRETRDVGETLLEIRDLGVRFGRRCALDGMTLTVRAGELFGLLGPNGAGKTTALRVAAGELAPDSGSVRLAGRDVSLQPPYLRTRLGMAYLPTASCVFLGFSVEDNLISSLELMTHRRGQPFRPSRRERRAIVQEMLDQFGLTHIRRTRADRISSGERRRLEIARALLSDPTVLMLDEPFTGIDPKTISELEHMLRDWVTNTTGRCVLISDHDSREILEICDRIAVITHGRLVFSGTPQSAVSAPEFRVHYFGEPFEWMAHFVRAEAHHEGAVADIDLRDKPARPSSPVDGQSSVDAVPHDAERTPSREAPPSPPVWLEGKMPDWVRPGARVGLEVRITPREVGGSSPLRPFGTPGGKVVTIVARCPELTLEDGNVRTVTLGHDGNSDWAQFVLGAPRPGQFKVELTAYHGGSFLGNLVMELSVGGDRRNAVPADRKQPMVLRARRESEITLKIDRVGLGEGEGQYQFTLVDGTIAAPLVSRSPRWERSPREAVEGLVSELNKAARQPSQAGADHTQRLLRGLGLDLWKEYLPADLRERLVERIDTITGLNVHSDDDVIPWELLRAPTSDLFLVEHFPVARWACDAPPPFMLRVSRAGFVWPGNVSDKGEVFLPEIQALRDRLGARQVRCLETVDTLNGLFKLFDSSEFDLLHLAGHNLAARDGVSAPEITIGGQTFRTAFLNEYAGRFKTYPLVFLNACRSGVSRPSYTELTGWAKKFLATGAGAFVGSLWDVRDTTAKTFAEVFYDELMKEGASLGTAMSAGRAAVKDLPGDPTWLAYTLYGDPAATVCIGGSDD